MPIKNSPKGCKILHNSLGNMNSIEDDRKFEKYME